MPNRLSAESSPYLLQHADNPVEWYPWGDEALQKARDEDKPILLSIGYAACHWCHVMAHESFEDPVTAALMNEKFVNIKVDREERPDLDSIYMSAVVAITGQGGWPMTVFLTPQGVPFYGGTYFPPTARHGMPAFRQVLQRVAEVWRERRDDIVQDGQRVAAHLDRNLTLTSEGRALRPGVLDHALRSLQQNYESKKGGWGTAPKFPQAMTIEFLLRLVATRDEASALAMATHTLDEMAAGGIYDHLGGGFARYSTDDAWLVPHFEKMLYDNALLARAYLHAWQVTGEARYRQVVEETLDWVIREMRHEGGGFYSSMDADSEGEEGKFYVWQPGEVEAALSDEDAALFLAYYDVSDRGNWEGKNILHTPSPLAEMAGRLEMPLAEARERLARARQKLYEVRGRRVWPGRDEKVLTAWNGLMLAAFAEAGRLFGRDDYIQVALENASFLRSTLRQENGRLLRTWRAGSEARYNAYLEDYAYLADGLIALYQTVFDPQWLLWAEELAEIGLRHFRDDENGGFFDTSDDHEALIQRPKDVQDNAVPSGNAMMSTVLLALSLYFGREDYWETAAAAIAAMEGAMAQYPTGFGQWLTAAAFMLGEPRELAIAGDVETPGAQALLAIARAAYRPFLVVAAGNAAGVPLLQERRLVDGEPTAYVCRRFLCQQPVTTAVGLERQLDGGA